jgi:hypothetical protein
LCVLEVSPAERIQRYEICSNTTHRKGWFKMTSLSNGNRKQSDLFLVAEHIGYKA